MSYEGYEQILCANGHQSFEDCYMFYQPEWRCFCGAEHVWERSVDQTNGDDESIGPFPLEVKTPAVICTCSCGNQHVTELATYHVPDRAKYDAWVQARQKELEERWAQPDWQPGAILLAGGPVDEDE